MRNNKIRKQFIWIVSCSLTVYAFSGGKGDCGLHGNCGWPMVGVFCLTVWRAACWDGHWSWQLECQPVILIAQKKKKKKAGTRKSALQTNYFCTGSLVTLSLGFLYELRHQIHNTRTMFKYVAAVLVINNNSNFKLKLQVKCLALWF